MEDDRGQPVTVSFDLLPINAHVSGRGTMQLALKHQLGLVLVVDVEIQVNLNLEIFKIVLDFVSHKLDIFHVVLQEHAIRLPLLEEEAMHPTQRQVGILGRVEDILEVVLRKALGLDIQAIVDAGEDVLLGGGFVEQVYATSVWVLSSHFLEIGWNYLAGTSLVGSQAQPYGPACHLSDQSRRARQFSIQPFVLLQLLHGRPSLWIRTQH